MQEWVWELALTVAGRVFRKRRVTFCAACAEEEWKRTPKLRLVVDSENPFLTKEHTEIWNVENMPFPHKIELTSYYRSELITYFRFKVEIHNQWVSKACSPPRARRSVSVFKGNGMLIYFKIRFPLCKNKEYFTFRTAEIFSHYLNFLRFKNNTFLK